MNGALGPNAASLRLVVILDSLRDDGIDDLLARAIAAVDGGATMLQLRLKDESARTLVEVAKRLRGAIHGVPLVVNGRADVALAAHMNGVHLGVDDLSPSVLRPVVPPGFIIGASCTSDGRQLDVRDADYLAAGPVFGFDGALHSSATLGVDGIREIVARQDAPVLAIGGITAENAALVLQSGASGVGVISGFSRASCPTTRVRAIRDALDASGR